MADQQAPDSESFAAVLAMLLAAKVGGITSQRGLGARLAKIRGTGLESERRNVRRHLRDGIEPEEETIVDYATAFGIDRQAFPPARRGGKTARAARQAVTLEERLATIVANLKRLERRLQRSGEEDWPELPGQIRDLRGELEGVAERVQGLRETLDSHREAPQAPSVARAVERGVRRS